MLKTMTRFNINTVNGTKSIPFDQFPAEAWKSLFGAGNNSDKYDLYERVPWLYRAVTIITEAIQSLPRNQEDLDNADVRVAWANFLNEIVGDYLFTGAMFCVIETNRLGKNRELRRFHPDTMELVTDKDSGLIAFKRKLNNTDSITYKRDELGYGWIPSRKAEIAIGTPPVQAALAAAGLLANIDDYGTKYLAVVRLTPP